jgi:transcription elongation factor Elf1
MAECPICLDETTGEKTTLVCGHEFHEECINKWKSRGKYTCPTCRTEFEKHVYKVTIRIEPLNFYSEHTTSNIQSVLETLQIDSDNVLASLSVFGINDLGDVLGDLGFSSLYSSLFNTESRTEF